MKEYVMEQVVTAICELKKMVAVAEIEQQNAKIEHAKNYYLCKTLQKDISDIKGEVNSKSL